MSEKSKRIRDAILGVKAQDNTLDLDVRYNIEDDDTYGVENAPPLELTEEIEKELIEGEVRKDVDRDRLRSQTKLYDNGVNVWRLITKTTNEFLDWEHVTTAMEVGGGCVVMVKEAIGQKMHSTAVYISGAKLRMENDKWVVR